MNTHLCCYFNLKIFFKQLINYEKIVELYHEEAVMFFEISADTMVQPGHINTCLFKMAVILRCYLLVFAMTSKPVYLRIETSDLTYLKSNFFRLFCEQSINIFV